MLRLTIEAVNADELYQQIRELCMGFTSKVVVTPDSSDVEPGWELQSAPVEATQEPAAPEPEEEPAPKPEASQEPQNEPQGPAAEEVRAALNKLRKTKGYDAVKNILMAHGSDNFPGLDKAHYAAVLKEAEADAAD